MKKKTLAIVTLASFLSTGVALADSGRQHGNQYSTTGKFRHGCGVMSQIDGNGDGQITREEAQKKREKIFLEADTDGNNILSLEEFKAMREKRKAARLQKKLLKFDENGDGVVAKEEFMNHAMLFKKFDLDGDGVITQTETAQVRSQHHRRGANRPSAMSCPNQGNWNGPATPPWRGYYAPWTGPVNAPWNGYAPGNAGNWANPGWGYGPNNR